MPREPMMPFDDRRDYYTDGRHSFDCAPDEPTPPAIPLPLLVPLQRFDLMSVRRTLKELFPASALTVPARSGIRSREEDH